MAYLPFICFLYSFYRPWRKNNNECIEDDNALTAYIVPLRLHCLAQLVSSIPWCCIGVYMSMHVSILSCLVSVCLSVQMFLAVSVCVSVCRWRSWGWGGTSSQRLVVWASYHREEAKVPHSLHFCVCAWRWTLQFRWRVFWAPFVQLRMDRRRYAPQCRSPECNGLVRPWRRWTKHGPSLFLLSSTLPRHIHFIICVQGCQVWVRPEVSGLSFLLGLRRRWRGSNFLLECFCWDIVNKSMFIWLHLGISGAVRLILRTLSFVPCLSKHQEAPPLKC